MDMNNTTTNITFKVNTYFDCNTIEGYEARYRFDPVWQQTLVGCEVLQILQQMYLFNVIFMEKINLVNLTEDERRGLVYPRVNDFVDIYAKPMAARSELTNMSYPIQAIYNWRFGFFIRRRYSGVLRAFYTLPFSPTVWECIYLMVLGSSIIFYLITWWERRLGGMEECSFSLELLFAVGAYYQHILPRRPLLNSRRMAYISFILFSYILHSSYTSNLLSRLVTNKNNYMSLEDVAASDYQVAILEDMKIAHEIRGLSIDKNMTIIAEKLRKAVVVNVSTGLEGVKTSKFALLCDFTSLYNIIKRVLDDETICELIEVNIYSNMNKYLYTSIDFPYKEQFKIGTLRIRESGVLERILNIEAHFPLHCDSSISLHKTQFDHTVAPLTILLGSYTLATIILIGERIHYKRNKVWPYVE